jgi:N-hydroxyarylamine O-acetyltransferase
MSDLDLPAYLARIGYTGELRPTAATMAVLHRRHAASIPFENLDVLAGKVPSLDLDSLQAKLVRGGRGGYCFEQNTLFAAVLEAVGFDVTHLAARVRYRTTAILPRTHMVLMVRADGADWLADVGFGGEGLLEPVPFHAPESRQFAWTYRLVHEPGQLVLQSRGPAGWADLYAFTREPQLPVDYELANYFVATHPSSPFTRTLTAQLPTPEARHILRDRDYTIDRGGAVTTRTLASDDELRAVLGEVFGLTVAEETRLRRKEGPGR